MSAAMHNVTAATRTAGKSEGSSPPEALARSPRSRTARPRGHDALSHRRTSSPSSRAKAWSEHGPQDDRDGRQRHARHDQGPRTTWSRARSSTSTSSRWKLDRAVDVEIPARRDGRRSGRRHPRAPPPPGLPYGPSCAARTASRLKVEASVDHLRLGETVAAKKGPQAPRGRRGSPAAGGGPLRRCAGRRITASGSRGGSPGAISGSASRPRLRASALSLACNPGTSTKRLNRHNIGFMVVECPRARRPPRAPFAVWTKGEPPGGRFPIALLEPADVHEPVGRQRSADGRFPQDRAANVIVVHDSSTSRGRTFASKVGERPRGAQRPPQHHRAPRLARLRARARRDRTPAPGLKGDVADYVLQNFDAMESAELGDVVDRACSAIEKVVADGLTPVNAVNTKKAPLRLEKIRPGRSVRPSPADRRPGGDRKQAVLREITRASRPARPSRMLPNGLAHRRPTTSIHLTLHAPQRTAHELPDLGSLVIPPSRALGQLVARRR